MKKTLIILIIGLIFSGCVSLQKVSVPEDLPEEVVKAQEEPMKEISEPLGPSLELQNIKGEELEGYVEKKGIIFSKTDFQGLLETRYVKFLFEDMDDPDHKFQLHIGENSDQQTFPWDVKTVKPGFEYTVEVLDEREEGIKVFRQDYPNFLQDISIKLMQVNGASPESI